ncbi:MAG: glutamate formimidoyltransferase [Euryarchaeota archaeon]|nr:glutamate formimidoyltransferase [Euryarchaeota archaeon]
MKLFECVPNFSDGQRPEVIRAIVAAAESVEGIAILDLESDTSHNRSVLTFVGEAGPVAEAAFHASRVAVEKIDLNHHKGEHPRMGAMDVVPFIPLGEATMEDAVAIARRFGARVAKELHVPVFYYGGAATRPERADLPNVREGQFEGIREAIATDPKRAPDEGERAVHPTAGAMAVGARPILVAYNVYLTTPDVATAKKIAKAIRGRDGGLAEVRALGFEIKEKDRTRAQVSMNMTDVRRTPLHRAFEFIRTEADRYGVGLEESEIVGLVPEDALLDAADHYLKLNRFDRHLVLERRVREKLAAKGLGSSSTFSLGPLASGSVEGFAKALSTRTPTPGGGSASAVAGAMGCGLAEMVLRYTAPADALASDLKGVVGEIATLRDALLRGVDEDARSYEAVRTARSAKKAAPEDRSKVQSYLDALHASAVVPLETAEACAKAEQLLSSVRSRVKPIFLSDVVTAEELLHAGKAGAVANAEINLASLREAGAPAEDIAQRLAKLGKST